jgi:hypothetical protein
LESNYQVVRIIGATGQRLSVALAQGNNDLNSATTLGVVTENINKNQEGFITTSGQVKEINTTGELQGEEWIDGDILYLSPTIAGQLTKEKPIAPEHSVIVGFVEYAHQIHGKIFVKVDNGYEIDELHNVRIESPANGDALVFNQALGVWENTQAVGPQGPQGEDGFSAYEVALQDGFIGTEEQWLASLKGEQGIQGIQGEVGPQGPQGVDSSISFISAFAGM